MYLSEKQFQDAARWRPFYLEAERRIGVPWALLAALHYRESNLGDRAGLPGGPLQFDPPLSAAQVRAYGAKYGIPDLTDPETDPRTAILCAAAFLQGKVAFWKEPPLTPGSDLTACALAAWSYNGRAYGSWQNSPYVANDPQNGVALHIRGTLPDGKGGRTRIDRPDPRPGVLAVMRELRARWPQDGAAGGAVAPEPQKAPAGPPVANGRLLLADTAGKFGPAPGPRFVYRGLVFSLQPSGDWWVRPANPGEG